MVQQSLEPLPRPPAALTSPLQRESPVSRDLLPERLEPWQISQYCVVLVVSTDDLFQPGSRHWHVHAAAQFTLTTRSFAAIRWPTVWRCTVNLPLLWILPQIWMKPRKSNVSDSISLPVSGARTGSGVFFSSGVPIRNLPAASAVAPGTARLLSDFVTPAPSRSGWFATPSLHDFSFTAHCRFSPALQTFVFCPLMVRPTY
jgi:hypothetical protein